MVTTRASSRAPDESSGAEESHEEPNPRRIVRKSRSVRSIQNRVEQETPRPRRNGSKARTEQTKEKPISRSQRSRSRQTSETPGEYFRDEEESRETRAQSEAMSNKLRKPRQPSFDSVLDRDEDVDEQEEDCVLQYGQHALRGMEQSIGKKSSNTQMRRSSKKSIDANREQSDESQSNAVVSYADLHIRPIRSKSWLSTDTGRPRGVNDAPQGYRTSFPSAGRSERRATEIFPPIGLPNRQGLGRGPGRSPNPNLNSQVQNSDRLRSSEPLSPALPEDQLLQPPNRMFGTREGQHRPNNENPVTENHPVCAFTWQCFGKAFVEHMKHGSRYWYRKLRLFWISLGLASWTFDLIVCSAGPLCNDVGRSKVQAAYLLASPLEAICLFGFLHLFYTGILDVLEGFAKVLVNIGIRTAHQQSQMQEGENRQPPKDWRERLLNSLWLVTFFDLLDNILEPLSMLASSLAFRVLLDHAWFEQWSSSFGLRVFKLCFISLCLHMTKWVVEALEEVVDLHTRQADPRRHIQRPLKTGFFLLLLLSAIYIHHELICFNVRQTWQYATAYSHGGHQLPGRQRTVHIATGPSSSVSNPTKIVYRRTEVVLPVAL